MVSIEAIGAMVTSTFLALERYLNKKIELISFYEKDGVEKCSCCKVNMDEDKETEIYVTPPR